MTQIEQTPGDRLRFEIILKSLNEGGNNLAILSEHDLVLDFYANLLDERLHALGDCDVEFCFSTNSERLVQKFNEILGELTVDEALTKEARATKRRYLVFRDSILMQDFELQLLARLVNGFPASNICVILLINSAGSNRNKLDAFGKTLLQWEVETRAGEPRKPMGDDWVAKEPEQPEEPIATPTPLNEEHIATEVAKALTPPNKPSWRIPGFGRKEKPSQPAADAQPLPEPPAALPEAAPAVSTASVLAASRASSGSGAAAPDLWLSPDEVAASPEAQPVFSRPKRKFPWWLLLWVPLLTAAVFAFMYRDLIEQEAESFRKYLLRGTPAPVAASDETAQPEAKEPEPSESAESKDKDAPTEEETKPVEPVQAQTLPSSKVEPVVAAAPPAPVTPPAPAVVQAPPAPEPAKAKEPVAEPKVKAKSDEAWIEQLAASSFVVQLAAFDTEEEMQAFKRSDAVYGSARVLKVRKKDSAKRYFVLIAGPFASKEEAQSFMQSNVLLAKGWLRSAKSLKAQL